MTTAAVTIKAMTADTGTNTPDKRKGHFIQVAFLRFKQVRLISYLLLNSVSFIMSSSL
jgi:hypothetical protein